jgi:hypothetical protein
LKSFVAFFSVCSRRITGATAKTNPAGVGWFLGRAPPLLTLGVKQRALLTFVQVLIEGLTASTGGHHSE